MNRPLDLVIRGGTILDGSGSEPYLADVGVLEGMIVGIGDLSNVPATEQLKADGAAIAPGFIDAHGHSDYTLLVDARAVSQISQGVTTEVIGNCGHGCEPLTDDIGRFAGNIYGYDGSVELSWRTTAQYLEKLRKAQPAINVFPLTPAGNLRRAVVANRDGQTEDASSIERAQMLRLIEEAMAAGSNGISFGLEYRQEASASFEELVEQSKAAGKLSGLVAIHTRDKDKNAYEAVIEAIAIARASGAPVQVSHILPRRTAQEGTLDRIMQALESARAEGLDLAFDVHTRTHGITNLSDCISADILEAERTEISTRLANPQWSEDVQREDSIIHRFASSGWDRVIVFSTNYTSEAIGRSISEFAESESCEPWEAIRRLLAATNGDVNNVMVVCDSYDREDILATASRPGCLVGSDATALSPDGPLAHAKFLGAYTWAAWFYSNITRSPRKLSPAQAVRKLAAEPAMRFGLSDRGTLETGKKADLVVFEPTKYSTNGTIADPNVLAQGVRHVVVNGVISFFDGSVTAASAGQVLRRIV